MGTLVKFSGRAFAALSVAVTVSAFLSGCVAVGHVYVSPLWQDVGIYRGLSSNATGHGFSSSAAENSATPSAGTAGFGSWRLPFNNSDTDDRWGADNHRLHFVRHASGPEGSHLVFQHDPESIMTWADAGVDPGAVWDSASDFIAATTGLAGGAEDVLAGRLVESRKPWTHAPAWASGFGYHYVISYRDGHRLEAHFQDLGGFGNFSTENTDRPQGLLPPSGSVILRNGGWAYHFDVEAVAWERNVEGRFERFWVTPDDAVGYVVRTDRERSSETIVRYLERALVELGRDVPATDDWSFEHTPIKKGLWGD